MALTELAPTVPGSLRGRQRQSQTGSMYSGGSQKVENGLNWFGTEGSCLAPKVRGSLRVKITRKRYWSGAACPVCLDYCRWIDYSMNTNLKVHTSTRTCLLLKSLSITVSLIQLDGELKYNYRM